METHYYSLKKEEVIFSEKEEPITCVNGLGAKFNYLHLIYGSDEDYIGFTEKICNF